MANGFAGNRVDAYLAGIIPINFIFLFLLLGTKIVKRKLQRYVFEKELYLCAN
jgi:hypothetical protein